MKKNQNQSQNQIMISRTAVLESDSDSDSHAKGTSRSITRAEINTLNGTNRMCVIYFYYLYTSNHSSDCDKFCSSCIIRMHDLFLYLRFMSRCSPTCY